MKFYFTYGTDLRFPFFGGWTEIEAPDKATACAAFRHYHPDRDPAVPCLNCAGVYTEEEFEDTTEFLQVNWRDHCQERITLTLTRELPDEETSEKHA